MLAALFSRAAILPPRLAAASATTTMTTMALPKWGFLSFGRSLGEQVRGVANRPKTKTTMRSRRRDAPVLPPSDSCTQQLMRWDYMECRGVLDYNRNVSQKLVFDDSINVCGDTISAMLIGVVRDNHYSFGTFVMFRVKNAHIHDRNPTKGTLFKMEAIFSRYFF
ncbi:hypothetical protein BC936DRAFT_148035 [Jimgerdemannia flammicorona]|uniref:Uncharacterized protein n=1 Tax=Jimgerdemannia flammicorona TaxID=994334 RepID=A0A433D400_9FUNG|nr:hypothetical protein BC936DRAFT_148035 [Jimgerdemannia flammicorona]